MKTAIRIFTVMLFFAATTILLSCKQNAECEKMIYEIPEASQKQILHAIQLHDLKKAIVVINIDYSTEALDLCFQEASEENKRFSELYLKTNRFLKISDTTFIPAITPEHLLLTTSKHILNTTGCRLNFKIDAFTSK